MESNNEENTFHKNIKKVFNFDDDSDIILSEDSEEKEIEELMIKNYEKTNKKNCNHYTNNCYVCYSCCKKIFCCWKCHHEETKHITVKATKIVCKKCYTSQQASKRCDTCYTLFGTYWCKKCNIYDNNNYIFHCDKCNICINGEINKFNHCDKCNYCYSEYHVCKKNRLKDICPMCDTECNVPSDNIIMECNHTIHEKCFNKLIKNSEVCPICKKKN